MLLNSSSSHDDTLERTISISMLRAIYLNRKGFFQVSFQNVLKLKSEADYGDCDIALEDYDGDRNFTKISILTDSTRDLLFVGELFGQTKSKRYSEGLFEAE